MAGEEGKKGKGMRRRKKGMKRKEVEGEGIRMEREEKGNKGEEVKGRVVGTGPPIG